MTNRIFPKILVQQIHGNVFEHEIVSHSTSIISGED